MNIQTPSAADKMQSPASSSDESNSPNSFGGGIPTSLLAGVILILTFAAYARTLRYQFVLDDRAWLLENPAMNSWKYLPDYFTKHVWAGVYPSDVGNYYRPAYMLWMRLNAWAFGSHPAGYHVCSVILHLLATLLVFGLGLRGSKDRGIATITALIFGLHPIHIESVAWILGSTDPLAAVFLLSSLFCWEKAHDRHSGRKSWLTGSLILFGLALLAKETAILFPALLFVHSWTVETDSDLIYGKAHRTKRGLATVAPYICLVIAYLTVRAWVLHGFSHPSGGAGWIAVFLTWPGLLALWLRHLFWPVGLSTYYDFALVTRAGFSNFVQPLLIVLAAGTLLLWGARKSRVLAIATAWLIVPVIPALDLRLFQQGDFAHDRFLYLSTIGFAMIVGWVVQRIAAASKRWFGTAIRAEAVAMLLAALLLPGTILESSYLRDEERLYTHNHQAAPENLIATTDLAAFLSEQGKYPESAALLEPLVREHPEDWGATYILGHDYYKMNRLPDAVTQLGRAIAVDSGKPEPYLDLGSAWFRLQKYDNAQNAFRRAIELRPAGKGYHFALGAVLAKMGQCEEAKREFEVELSNYPDEAIVKQQMSEAACGP